MMCNTFLLFSNRYCVTGHTAHEFSVFSDLLNLQLLLYLP